MRKVLILSSLLLLTAQIQAEDWPTWRYDASRRGVSPEVLPKTLHLQYVLELPFPKPAWPTSTQSKLQFDRLYEPILAENTLFVPFMGSDKIVAYEADTGKEKWRFYAEGPIRLAASYWDGKVYFTSDDGFLYCISAKDGELIWKFKGAPDNRKVLGNERMVSAWPARGAPVIHDGKVYFGASIWPFMGIFFHSLDAKTGEEIWRNTGTGSNYLTQQHSSPAFAGVSPQGYLAVSGDKLVVSGGRTIPAVLDRNTGKFEHFVVDSRAMGSKGGGGFEVVVGENFYLNRGKMYRLDNGKFITSIDALVVSDIAIFAKSSDGLVGFEPRYRIVESKDRKGKVTKKIVVRKLFSFPVSEKIQEIFIQSGNRLYCGGDGNKVFSVDLPKGLYGADVHWTTTLPEKPLNMISGDGKLFVSTEKGKIFCFGKDKVENQPEAKPADDLDGQLTLVPEGALWRFNDNVIEDIPGWTSPDYDDSKWGEGASPLGYGEDFVKTEISYGGNKDKKRLAAYFRHHFEMPTDFAGGDFDLDITLDDGAIIYLNGKEVKRLYMPKGKVTPSTKAESGATENKKEKVVLPTELFKPGRNVLAVQVHQVKPTSSDLIMRLEMGGKLIRAKKVETPTIPKSEIEKQQKQNQEANQLVKTLLDSGARKAGYALVMGVGSGTLINTLLSSTDLHIVVVETQSEVVKEFRERMDRAGVYGRRVAIIEGSFMNSKLPPYFADWVVTEDVKAAGASKGRPFLEQVYHCLRPYSGRATWLSSKADSDTWIQSVKKKPLDAGKAVHQGQQFVLHRTDAPEGSSEWTHQNGDVANSVTSKDVRVKLPLGVLWFGGPSNEGVLPRHGHGPTPQIVAGRLFIEGRSMLRAIDIYTGRFLWERQLKDVGIYYDYTSHEPGANAIGSNYVSLADGVYVVYKKECLRLDPKTGKTISAFKLPKRPGEKDDPEWGYIGISGDTLLAGAELEDFVTPDYTIKNFNGLKGDGLKKEIAAKIDALVNFKTVDERKRKTGKDAPMRAYLLANVNKLLHTEKIYEHITERILIKKDAEGIVEEYKKYLTAVPGRKADDHGALVIKRKLLNKCFGLPGYSSIVAGKFNSHLRTGSKRLVAMDRHSGKVLWEHEGAYRIRHNSIAVGGGKVFFIDKMNTAQEGYFKRRGLPYNEKARVVALNLKTGKEVWEDKTSVFGTWLSYSVEHDVVLQAGSKARDRANDEVGQGMTAYQGKTGEIIWKNSKKYEGPCILLGEWVITQGYGNAGYALDIFTGKPITVKHPISGKPTDWKYTRNYGCNTAIGFPNLLTFRSAAAGYYDLLGESGTGNLGGFRSGCTSNLIAAGGILSAPDYTRTCTCSYQNQASVGLVHAPDVEMWTFSPHSFKDASVARAGVNLGAPGDRRGPEGTYWLDFPSVGGKSPDLPITAKLAGGARYVRRHESELEAHPLKWVGASALVGSGDLSINLVHGQDAGVTVKSSIHSAELKVLGAAPSASESQGQKDQLGLTATGKEGFSAKVSGFKNLSSDSITCEVWVKAKENFDYLDARISGKDKQHGFVIDNKKVRVRYFISNRRGKDNEGVITLEAKDEIPKDRWTHVAFTYDAESGTGSLYISGKLVAENKAKGKGKKALWWDSATPDLAVGAGLKPGSAIDEIRISNKVLDPKEFSLNQENKVDSKKHIAHWSFNQLNKEISKQSLTKRFSVRLIFAELEDLSEGKRKFDVLLQDKVVLEDFDISKEAGGINRTLVKEFYNIPVEKNLNIKLQAKGDQAPILSGVQVFKGVQDF